MAGTINGIGTRYYGRCKFRRDGSYITTKWVVVVHVPFVPLGSYRVMDEETTGGFFSAASTSYMLVASPALEWMQVLRVWSYVALWCGLAYLIDYTKASDRLIFLLFGLILSLPFIMRWFARRDAGVY